MKRPLLILGVALAPPIALLVSAPVAAQGTAADAKYLAQPMGAYKNLITVTDNVTTPKIVVSSQSAWTSANSDMYLAATIDRNTREVRYFTYQVETVTGDWAGYNKAELTTPAGPVEVKVSFTNNTIVSCVDPAPCTLQEFVAFPIERSLLDQYAGRTPPSDRLQWQLRSSKGAKDATGTISIGEIRAFLAQVDSVAKKK